MFCTTVTTLCLVLAASTVAANGGVQDQVRQERDTPVASSILIPPNADDDRPLPSVQIGGPTRGPFLPVLYATLAGLNAFDAYSTSQGLSRGAQESNPAMRAIAGNTAGLWAVKGGATAVSIVVAERLWRTHRRAEAIAVTIIANGAMAAVAARNAAVLRVQR